MTEVHSFAPIARNDATCLILGTMPGTASLAKHQYYGHRRNAFWPLLLDVLGLPADLDYDARCEALRVHRIALWDVLQCCRREGSLDSAIDPESMQANDFAGFLARHPQIRRVYFNGQPAARLWRALVHPTLPPALAALECAVLPSTSPAHAAMTLAEKRQRWHILRQQN
ncbi:MAG TPA: DNA-deoxyinosine glycosylase [Candidatus Acidoferrum sp.]|nr:DNA-deoxyinosine glycosylase [Candidatus Acidoferrum sp.]